MARRAGGGAAHREARLGLRPRLAAARAAGEGGAVSADRERQAVTTDPRLPELFAAAERAAARGARRHGWPALGDEDAALAARGRASSSPPPPTTGELLDRSPLACRRRRDVGAAPALPPRIGPYRVLRELGRGGMGRVYLAEQEGDGFRRTVALKLLDSAAATPQALRRFRDEVRILAALEHPGIARFLDGGRSRGRELLPGARVRRGHRPARARRGARPRRRGAPAALPRGPRRGRASPTRAASSTATSSRATCWSAADGRPRLLDFGISKLVDADAEGRRRRAPSCGRSRPPTRAPSRSAASRSPPPPTSTRSASCSTSCSPARGPSARRRGRRASSSAPCSSRTPSRRAPPRAAPAAPRRPGRRRRPRRSDHPAARRAHRPPTSTPSASRRCARSPGSATPAVADFADDLRRYLAGEPVAARRGGWRYRAARRLRRYRGADRRRRRGRGGARRGRRRWTVAARDRATASRGRPGAGRRGDSDAARVAAIAAGGARAATRPRSGGGAHLAPAAPRRRRLLAARLGPAGAGGDGARRVDARRGGRLAGRGRSPTACRRRSGRGWRPAPTRPTPAGTPRSRASKRCSPRSPSASTSVSTSSPPTPRPAARRRR